MSLPVPVTSGVPQNLFWGPLLYNNGCPGDEIKISINAAFIWLHGCAGSTVSLTSFMLMTRSYALLEIMTFITSLSHFNDWSLS